jgi:hypothetical protein
MRPARGMLRYPDDPAHTKDLLDSRPVVHYSLILTRSLGQRLLSALPVHSSSIQQVLHSANAWLSTTAVGERFTHISVSPVH